MDIQWDALTEKQRWEMFLKVFRENAAFNESIERMTVEQYVSQNNALPQGYANILNALRHNKQWANERVWATDGHNTYEHNTPWQVAMGCISIHFLNFLVDECGFEWMKEPKIVHWIFCLQMYEEIVATGFLQHVLSMMFFGKAVPDVLHQIEYLCANESKGRLHYIKNTFNEIKKRTGSNKHRTHIQTNIDILNTLIQNKHEKDEITKALNGMKGTGKDTEKRRM